MKNESSKASLSWKIDSGIDGTLYRIWRFFSNISDNLLLGVTVNKTFTKEIVSIQKKLNINVEQLKAKLTEEPCIKNKRILYFILRYANDLPKDEIGYVTGHDSYIQDYDGLGSKEPKFLLDEDTALLLKDLESFLEFENKIGPQNIESIINDLLAKYHLSYRYYRRIKSILFYNDFPPVPSLWNIDRSDYEDDSVGTFTKKELKELEKMSKKIKQTYEIGVNRTPITYVDRDKKCVVVEIYPDTSLDLFSNKYYKQTLIDTQKSLLGYRGTDFSYEGYADIIYYYLTEIVKLPQKKALSQMRRLYGRKYVRGFDSDLTAKASTKKRRYQKKYIEDITE